MIMSVLNNDGENFINFNIDVRKFKKGEVIEHEKLEGKFQVVHVDPATVTVKPI